MATCQNPCPFCDHATSIKLVRIPLQEYYEWPAQGLEFRLTDLPDVVIYTLFARNLLLGYAGGVCHGPNWVMERWTRFQSTFGCARGMPGGVPRLPDRPDPNLKIC